MSGLSTLDELSGLNAAKSVVRQLASKPSGVHSVLLYGAEGAGKGALVDILVETWLRQTPEPSECRAVNAFRRGNTADVMRIEPSGPSNWISKKAIVNEDLKKEDSTPLRDFFRTMPLLGKHKIAVISDCHRLTSDAANALLKTLEEPFPHAKLILTTNSVGSVLATIRSRCLCVACELPPVEALGELLDYELRLSEGAPGKLRRLRQSAEPVARLAKFAGSLSRRSSGEALVVAEEFKEICEQLEKAEGTTARFANANCLELLAVYLVREPASKPNWTQDVIEAHRRILCNGSANLIFTALFAKMLTS